jgi:hypothetical protein
MRVRMLYRAIPFMIKQTVARVHGVKQSCSELIKLIYKYRSKRETEKSSSHEGLVKACYQGSFPRCAEGTSDYAPHMRGVNKGERTRRRGTSDRALRGLYG